MDPQDHSQFDDLLREFTGFIVQYSLLSFIIGKGYCVRVQRTTLRICDPLGLAGLREALILLVFWFITVKGFRLKSVQGKGIEGKQEKSPASM